MKKLLKRTLVFTKLMIHATTFNSSSMILRLLLAFAAVIPDMASVKCIKVDVWA